MHAAVDALKTINKDVTVLHSNHESMKDEQTGKKAGSRRKENKRMRVLT